MSAPFSLKLYRKSYAENTAQNIQQNCNAYKRYMQTCDCEIHCRKNGEKLAKTTLKSVIKCFHNWTAKVRESYKLTIISV